MTTSTVITNALTESIFKEQLKLLESKLENIAYKNAISTCSNSYAFRYKSQVYFYRRGVKVPNLVPELIEEMREYLGAKKELDVDRAKISGYIALATSKTKCYWDLKVLMPECLEQDLYLIYDLTKDQDSIGQEAINKFLEHYGHFRDDIYKYQLSKLLTS